ncbi:MAG: DUF2007 domain-containing protein [Bacteroidales bacterium]|nr:DUF2007 domain-containing protein [Bacteroidales bacterium]
MENWTTIITFTYPHQAHLAKAKLESEGVEVVINDEFTVQIHNFYSNAIGGVKLLVRNVDSENAHQILANAGYIVEDNKLGDDFMSQFDSVSSKLPIIRIFKLEIRMVITVLLIIAIVLIPIILLS